MARDRSNASNNSGTRRQPSRVEMVLIVLCGLSVAPLAAVAGGLHDAVRARDETAVTALLKSGVPADESDFLFGTALHVAAAEGHADIARILIENGADVKAVSELKDARALHLAARFGHVDVLAVLLDSGADIEARDQYRQTPLSRAAKLGHVEAVRLLLDRGANIETREEKFGAAPLHEAALHGHIDVVKLLLEYGADVNAKNNTGRTPFWAAAFPHSYNVVGDASLLEYLMAKGADPNVRDVSGMSMLTYAEFQERQGAVIFGKIAEELRRLGTTR